MFPSFGVLKGQADRLLEQAFQTSVSAARSLRREVHDQSPSCWLHGAGYCFSRDSS
jgi:hypothetical protein